MLPRCHPPRRARACARQFCAGKIAYAKYTLVLIVVPLVLVLGIYHVLIYYFKREEYLRSTAVSARRRGEGLEGKF